MKGIKINCFSKNVTDQLIVIYSIEDVHSNCFINGFTYSKSSYILLRKQVNCLRSNMGK